MENLFTISCLTSYLTGEIEMFFIGVLVYKIMFIVYIIHSGLETQKLFFPHLQCPLIKYLSTLEEKFFISGWP